MKFSGYVSRKWARLAPAAMAAMMATSEVHAYCGDHNPDGTLKVDCKKATGFSACDTYIKALCAMNAPTLSLDRTTDPLKVSTNTSSTKTNTQTLNHSTGVTGSGSSTTLILPDGTRIPVGGQKSQADGTTLNGVNCMGIDPGTGQPRNQVYYVYTDASGNVVNFNSAGNAVSTDPQGIVSCSTLSGEIDALLSGIAPTCPDGQTYVAGRCMQRVVGTQPGPGGSPFDSPNPPKDPIPVATGVPAPPAACSVDGVGCYLLSDGTYHISGNSGLCPNGQVPARDSGGNLVVCDSTVASVTPTPAQYTSPPLQAPTPAAAPSRDCSGLTGYSLYCCQHPTSETCGN